MFAQPGPATSRGGQPSARGGRPRNGLAAPNGTCGPLAALAYAGFRLLSSIRGRRIFHPVGVGYAATLRVPAAVPGLAGVRLFEAPGEHEAVCRLSRGGGLPEPVPDVLGLALRLPDAYAPGRHQDFLLATSARGPLLQHLLLPGLRGFFRQPFSTLLPYSFNGAVRVVIAGSDHPPVQAASGTLGEVHEAAGRGDLRYMLAIAPLTGGPAVTLGELEIGARLPDVETERLAFTPWHTGGGIRPVGPLQRLRQPAYRGSQRGRGLEPPEIP